MTRYVLAYYGTPIRGPFDWMTEAAIVALFVRVANPSELEILQVADASAPAEPEAEVLS